MHDVYQLPMHQESKHCVVCCASCWRGSCSGRQCCLRKRSGCTGWTALRCGLRCGRACARCWRLWHPFFSSGSRPMPAGERLARLPVLPGILLPTTPVKFIFVQEFAPLVPSAPSVRDRVAVIDSILDPIHYFCDSLHFLWFQADYLRSLQILCATFLDPYIIGLLKPGLPVTYLCYASCNRVPHLEVI